MENPAQSIEKVCIYAEADDERPTEARAMVGDALSHYAIKEVVSFSEADAMIVIGGDGAFNHAAHSHGFSSLPMIGINTGQLGYYMNTMPTQPSIHYLIRNLSEGDFRIVDLPVLELHDSDGNLLQHAVNDFVIKATSFQAFKASLVISGVEFKHFVGGGLCFSTPQGSSAEGTANGGSLMKEGVPAWQIVTEGAHLSKDYDSLMAPLVLELTDDVVINVKEAYRRPFAIGADGKEVEVAAGETTFRITPGLNKAIRRIRLNDNSYLQDIARIFRGQSKTR